MPARAIHHVDLAVTDVDRSLDFYLAILGPLGLAIAERYPSYRRTEEVLYLRWANQMLGLRPADGGKYEYYAPGLEHLAFYVDSRQEVDEAYQRALEIGANVHFPPEVDKDLPDYYEMFVWDPDGLRIEVAYGPPGSEAG
jgi:glyoxylase I family protein